ncbi:MAG: phosphate/phosphite/phosphonate ABC transporter substrate-binding protein [Thiobacillaceae bacterium]|jgi:phosphonate transport system substrate-binding protein|nr:phosphate/phosphite/phosphonate ABC transporter substrate-binding protein [Thiobacillaceae bacterium]
MNPRRRLLLALALAALTRPVAARAAAPLRIGLFPNLSTHALLGMYQPLREYLETALRRVVTLETAPDFPTFARRLLAREYDLAVAAPHLARLAQVDAGYAPLFSYRASLQGQLVVPRTAPYRQVRDLGGKRIAFPDAIAIISMLGEDLLRQAGLQTGKNVQVIDARSHNNAVRMVLAGQADAAMIGSLPFAGLPAEQREPLRILASTPAIPSQYVIASPALSGVEAQAILTALRRFAASAEGRAFFEQHGLVGLDLASSGELMLLDPYVARVRQAIGGKDH